MKRLLPILATLLMAAHPASALTEAEILAGRSIVNRYADTVVAVRLVVTMDMSLGERTLPAKEFPRTVNATVISSSGLAVTALSAMDLSSEIARARTMLGAAARNLHVGEAQFKEAMIVLADGTEVPARVVLKDSATDLAFIAPIAAPSPSRTFLYVHLENAAKPELLGNCFDLGRASRELHRVPLINPCTIVGIYDGPRPAYLVSSERAGCPVFNERGSVLGICVHYISQGHALNFVVLPANQIAEVAVQAAAEAAKPPPEPAPSADDDSGTDNGAGALPAPMPKP